MIIKLVEAAEKSWRRLNGHNPLPKVILGVKFTGGRQIANASRCRLTPCVYDAAIAPCTDVRSSVTIGRPTNRADPCDQ